MENIQLKRQPKIDWNDREAVRAYQREQYHKNKPQVEKENKIDWSNEDAKRQYYKNYYENNKERLIKQKQEKTMCELCNKEVCKDSILKHNNSQIHKLAVRLTTNI